MRLLLALWLLLPLLSGRGAATPPTEPPAQLPAPQNLRVLLYNRKQVLSWDPVPPLDDARPVVYQVQFKYPVSGWNNVVHQYLPHVNCTGIAATTCDLTAANSFLPFHYKVTLRVRACQDPLTSGWAYAPSFMHYQDVTIGPPEDLVVEPGEGALIVRFSEPFTIPIDSERAFFQYFVCFWENSRCIKEEGPFRENHITLPGLRPSRRHCVRVRAGLASNLENSMPLSQRGHYSNVTCGQPGPDASAEKQQAIYLSVAILALLVTLVVGCFYLVLRYRRLIKLWFHTPPGIPGQIEEYLKDPAHPILVFLDQDNSPNDDTWDRVSIISAPGPK